MTLKEILSARSDDGILVKLLLRHPLQISNLPRAIEALHELRNADLKKPELVHPFLFNHFWTVVHKKQESNGKPANWDVVNEGPDSCGRGHRVAKARHCAWDSILRREVVYKVNGEIVGIPTLTEDEQDDLLAAILYEITWDRFTDKERSPEQDCPDDWFDGHI